jgi:ubiquinol-cytochrome c reductase cytochrome b subunit
MIGTLYVAGKRAPWSPEFHAQPLPPQLTVGLSGDAVQGAELFHAKGCEACHMIAGEGGNRGPNLTVVGNRLTREQLVWRIANGGTNMPAYGGNLSPKELDALVDFLQTRRSPGTAERAGREASGHAAPQAVHPVGKPYSDGH